MRFTEVRSLSEDYLQCNLLKTTWSELLQVSKRNKFMKIFILRMFQHVLSDLYGVPFVKILYLTDLAQKLLSLRRDS